MVADLEQARLIAANYLRSRPLRNDEAVILDSQTVERKLFWVFVWSSRHYQETGDESYLLFGNAPVVVMKANGQVRLLGTHAPVEQMIDEFERQLVANG
jgi:hypothetical protein